MNPRSEKDMPDIKRQQTIKRVSPEDSPCTPTEKAPDPDLGHAIVPKERYTSKEFAALEWQHIWTRVWLLGGRSIDIPEPGDYICTEIGSESILIVRQSDGKVRAFYNVCQHRGNRLVGRGTGSVEKSFVCSFHAWEYNFDGTFKHILDADTFPQGPPPCRGLPELPCAEWGSFVWFSLNPDVEALEEYLDPVHEHLAPYNFHKMAQTRDITVEWECNWKTSVDAFNESYHVKATHPQLMWHLDDLNVQIDCYERHNRYLIPFGCLSQRVPVPPDIPPGIKLLMNAAGMDPADYDGRVTGIRADLQRWMREHGPGQGKDYSRLNDDQLTDDYHYLIFPNVTLNTHADDLMLFRQRPHESDPNKMYFDIWTFVLVPDGEEWPDRPEHQQFKRGEKSIGLVLDQDSSNLPNVQAGMNSSGYQGLWLSQQELRIRHFHKVIDDYIYGPGNKPEGAQ